MRNFLDNDGGLNLVTSKSGNGQMKQVASNFDYSATGDVRKMKLGNGLWETLQVDERFQLKQVGLGTTATNNNLFKVDYEYGELNSDGTTVDTSKNIGMIAKTTTTIPTTSFTQTFKYDAINRLTEAKELAPNNAQNWKQTFGYDIFGNRNNFTQIVGTTTLATNAITKPTIDQSNNQFTTGQGYVYDFNGNLIQDAEGRSFKFDGNDKQVEVKSTNNPSQIIGNYFYDASGARVKKVVGNETTVFVYDAGGALAAEYSTATPTTTPTTSYMTTDHLGSPRVITDKNGAVISRRDFMPFGEEIYAGVGGRNTNQKYANFGSDNIRKRYTGYEKDDETQLDFAQARMYQNKHGRFTAVDPLMASASPGNPQTFNRYSYTGNDPVNMVDPSGLYWCQKGSNYEFRENTSCQEGWEKVDGQQTQITGGDWSDVGGKVGDVVTLNANGTITLIRHGTDAEVAQASGTQVVATSNEVTTTDAGSMMQTTINNRPTEPVPDGNTLSLTPDEKLVEAFDTLSKPNFIFDNLPIIPSGTAYRAIRLAEIFTDQDLLADGIEIGGGIAGASFEITATRDGDIIIGYEFNLAEVGGFYYNNRNTGPGENPKGAFSGGLLGKKILKAGRLRQDARTGVLGGQNFQVEGCFRFCAGVDIPTNGTPFGIGEGPWTASFGLGQGVNVGAGESDKLFSLPFKLW